MRSVLPVVARLITLGELISKVDFDEKTVSSSRSNAEAKGPREGEKCVKKVFKSGSVFEDSFFSLDIAAST